jgi:hypothetical protein
MDWFNLVQDGGRLQALQSMVLNFQVVQNAGKFFTPCGGVASQGLCTMELYTSKGKKNGKGHPITGHEGPEVE